MHVGEKFGEYEARERGVVEPCSEDVLDRAECRVPGLAELVDEMAISVLGKGGGPRAVVAAFEEIPRVELFEQGSGVGGAQLPFGRRVAG